MRPSEGETYKSWLDRARMYEQGLAMQRIAQGESPEKVLEDLSRRLTEKMLHPVYKFLLEGSEMTFNAEESRKTYEEIMKYHKPVADQVDGNLFDKDEKK